MSNRAYFLVLIGTEEHGLPHVSDEGPWERRQDAIDFGENEVGVEWDVVDAARACQLLREELRALAESDDLRDDWEALREARDDLLERTL